MAVTDAQLLIFLLDKKRDVLLNNETGQHLTAVQERIEFLIARLQQAREKLVIPTPVLSEVLVRADDAREEYLAIMTRRSVFKVAPFDIRAAVELAEINRLALASGGKKQGSDEPYQKIKLDRQIISIAKALGETTIYSGDKNLAKFAEIAGLQVILIEDLPLPEPEPQHRLDFEAPEPQPAAVSAK